MDATDGVTVGATLFICGMGLLALVAGAYNFLRALSLSRRCTGEAAGTVVDLVDEDFGKKRRRARALRPEDIEVLAANEAIAKKKRAYQFKKLTAEQAAADSKVATWRPLVTYTVSGVSYEVKAARAVVFRRDLVGSGTAVHYDPAKPGRVFWLELDGLPRSLGLMLLLCGAALVLVGAAVWFILPMLSSLSGGEAAAVAVATTS